MCDVMFERGDGYDGGERGAIVGVREVMGGGSFTYQS